ncbi:hypothetical protein [Longitalea luteola]|uniref:hypothetical protein n=1 Tax=Longitalea luteola TaxID=2812563 RepID=UPI001A974B6C|nr:hypothetical protein [Longitalea luteola]
MSEKKNSSFSLLRILILGLAGASVILFVLTATLCSLFGYSLWSWINVLRFIIGGGIAFVACIYFFLVKSMISSGFKK